jgi:hypothetical protein
MESNDFSCVSFVFSSLHLNFQQVDFSACYLLHSGFLLGLFFNPEDGGDSSFEMSDDFQWTTWQNVPADRTVHNINCHLRFANNIW